MTFPFLEFTLVEGFLVGFPTEILRFLLSFLFSESIAICRFVFGRGRSSRDKFGWKYRSDRFIRSSINGGLLSRKKKWKRKRPILSDIYRSTRVDVSSCLTRGEKSGERRNTSEISEENVLSTRNERADGARLLVGGW